jgi:hypothetical protein
MEGTIRITERDLEREVRWLREAGHHFPACLMERLWREVAATGADGVTLGRGAMDAEDLGRLRPGETVRHLPTGESFVVTSCHAGRVTAVRTADVSDPREWERVPDGR